MTFQQTIKKITSGNLAPIYFLLGMEEHLLQTAINQLGQQVLQNDDDWEFNFLKFNMLEHSLDDALFEAESLPFFGETKFVLIENPYFFTGQSVTNAPDHHLEHLEEYINNPSPSTVIVFKAPYEKLDKRKKISKLIDKKAVMVNCQPLSEKQVVEYMREYIHCQGYKIEENALDVFVHRVDYNLTLAIQEIQKLFLYHIEDQNIQIDSIESLVSKSLEQNVFEINDQILNNKPAEAIQTFSDLVVQKEEPIKIIAILMSQLRLFIQVKILKGKGHQEAEIAKLLKIHPYRVKLAFRQEKRFKLDYLIKAYRELIVVDYNIKIGKMDSILQFEVFILRFTES